MAHEAAFSHRQHARDLLEAIRVLKAVEADGRAATPDERATLRRFGGFGPVANQVFPHPITGYKPGWEGIGVELASLLTPDELASARQSTFNAFYTAEPVMQAVYAGLARLGVPDDAHVLEPGCGIGRFADHAPPGMRFTGVELEDLSGRIARLLHPEADIRIEGFQDTRLPPGAIEAAVGNVPFGDIDIRHAGNRFSLHDFFFAKAVDTLAPGGVLGFVTSSFTLDKHGSKAREWLADRADFLGAIRLTYRPLGSAGAAPVAGSTTAPAAPAQPASPFAPKPAQ